MKSFLETHEKCIRCGQDLEKTDSPRKCTSCGFNHYINMIPAVDALIVNEKNQVLLGRRVNDPEKDLLDLPGGFTNLGESLQETLEREVLEEVGIKVSGKESKFITSYYEEYPFQNTVYPVLVCVFEVKVDAGVKITSGDDIKEARFYNIREFDIKEISFAHRRENLKEYFELLAEKM